MPNGSRGSAHPGLNTHSPGDTKDGVEDGAATLLTAQEVAHFLRCSTKTVLALVRHEGLPSFRLRSRLRFQRRDVLEWARRRSEEGR